MYSLSSIASGNSKQKKLVLEERFLTKALDHLKSSPSTHIKIGVLNLILNLVYKEQDGSSGESKARKQIVDMGITQII